MSYKRIRYSCPDCKLVTDELKCGDGAYVFSCKRCRTLVNVWPEPFSLTSLPCPKCATILHWADSGSDDPSKCPCCGKSALAEQLISHFSTGYLNLPKVGQSVCGFYTERGWGAELKAFMKESGIEPVVPEDPRVRVHLIASGAEGFLAEPAPKLLYGTPIECKVLSTGKSYVEIVLAFVRSLPPEEC